MAKVILPLMSEAARGKFGGSIFNQWRSIQYAKRWASPTNPGTPAQLARRAALTTFTRSWATLTNAQRDELGRATFEDGLDREAIAHHWPERIHQLQRTDCHTQGQRNHNAACSLSSCGDRHSHNRSAWSNHNRDHGRLDRPGQWERVNCVLG